MEVEGTPALPDAMYVADEVRVARRLIAITRSCIILLFSSVNLDIALSAWQQVSIHCGLFTYGASNVHGDSPCEH